MNRLQVAALSANTVPPIAERRRVERQMDARREAANLRLMAVVGPQTDHVLLQMSMWRGCRPRLAVVTHRVHFVRLDANHQRLHAARRVAAAAVYVRNCGREAVD